MDAKEEKHRCLECFAIFDATEAAFDTKQIVHGDEVSEGLQVLCPHCGSMNLKGAFEQEA
jgi:DNA-directed RNA polymerase subunit RPC12/RpoP